MGGAQSLEGTFGQVDDTPLPDKPLMRTAVIDAQNNRLAVSAVGHLDHPVELHSPHRAGHVLIVEDFVAGGSLVDAAVSSGVPGCLPVAGVPEGRRRRDLLLAGARED